MTNKQQLKTLVTIISGMAFSGADADPKGRIPVVLASAIKADSVLDSFNHLQKIAELPARSPAVIKDGDVLMVSRVTPGSPFKASCVKTTEPLIATSSIYILRVASQSVLPEYLCHYLNSVAFQKAMLEHAKGSTITHVTKSELGEILIPVPSLSKQKIIIELKENIKKQITLHIRQQQLKEQAMQATFLNL